MGRVLDDGIALFRLTFKRVYPFSLIGAALIALPSVFAPDLAGLGGSIKPGEVPSFASFAPMFLGLWFVGLLAYQIAYAVVMLKMVESAEDNPYRSQKNIFANAVVKGLLLLIPTFLYLIVFFLASMAFFIPGLILGLSMCLYMPLMVLQNTGAFRSLGESHRLIWGNWWRTATILTVPFILMSLLAICVYGIWGIAMTFDKAFVTGQIPMGLQLANAAVSSLSTPLLVSVLIVQMHDLKLRREGADLAARLAG